jgi:hypothetical protein
LVSCLLALACSLDAGAPVGATDGSTSDPSTSSTTDVGTSAATTSVSAGDSTSSSSTSGDETTSSSSSAGSSTGAATPWGMVDGDCGVLGPTELGSSSPLTFDNSIDFGTVGFDYDRLSEGGKTIHDVGNLGGSSLLSEVVSFEILARCEDATLLKTEGEIVYTDPMGTKTDLLLDIDGLMVGVSVTRAYAFPPRDPYTVQQASELLTDKLGDILISNDNVAPEDAWTKAVLHVIAYEDMHAQSIATAYEALDASLKADTIVMVTVTDGDDAFVYD